MLTRSWSRLIVSQTATAEKGPQVITGLGVRKEEYESC